MVITKKYLNQVLKQNQQRIFILLKIKIISKLLCKLS